MRSDSEEFDLYPPDAEDQPKDARQARLRAAFGTVLVVWGTGLLVERAIGREIDAGLLGIGLGALAGWAQLRRYPWFAVGAILTGFGFGGILEDLIGGAFGESLSSLVDAAGFAAVYVRYPRRSRWALIPAGIFLVIGLGAFGVGLIGLLPDGLGRLLLPTLLITAGGILLFRQSLPRNAVRVALPVVGAAFVVVAASHVPDVGQLSFGGEQQQLSAAGAVLPPLEGKTLVVLARSEDVTLTTGPPRVEATVSRFGGSKAAPRLDVESRDDSDRVVVRLEREGGTGFAIRSAHYRVQVPEGTRVRIETSSGGVTGRMKGGDVEVETSSGDVELDVEGTEDAGELVVRTKSGRVEIESHQELDLDLRTDSGEIEVNGDEKDEGEPFERRGSGPRVEVETRSGDIDIDDAA